MVIRADQSQSSDVSLISFTVIPHDTVYRVKINVVLVTSGPPSSTTTGAVSCHISMVQGISTAGSSAVDGLQRGVDANLYQMGSTLVSSSTVSYRLLDLLYVRKQEKVRKRSTVLAL
jgi:hypothetical protein